MTILINKKINLNNEAEIFIQKYINYVHDVNPNDLYEGMNNKQILKNKFIFQIYQLENLDLVNVDLHVTNNTIYVLARFWNSKIINIGAVPLTNSLKIALAQDSYPTLSITGGHSKKVVTDEYGEDSIVDVFEPYQINLEVHKAEPVDYKIEKIDTIYHYAFKSEQSLITISKSLMMFFAVFGLILGLGFMFLGYFLTGLMVIIAFFGVNSYTLLLADSHMQTQRQRVNS